MKKSFFMCTAAVILAISTSFSAAAASAGTMKVGQYPSADDLAKVGISSGTDTISVSLIGNNSTYNYIIPIGEETSIGDLPQDIYKIKVNDYSFFKHGNIYASNMLGCSMDENGVLTGSDEDCTVDLTFDVSISDWRGYADSEHFIVSAQ